jgi:hypothetical protein
VLKPGGKVVTHGLLGDRPLPGEQPNLPGLAAMVSRVPAGEEVVRELRAAGFVHDGVGLREVKFVAHRPAADQFTFLAS